MLLPIGMPILYTLAEFQCLDLSEVRRVFHVITVNLRSNLFIYTVTRKNLLFVFLSLLHISFRGGSKNAALTE
jgi:hypothetical protein